MPLSNAGKNAIQAYGMKRFAYNPPATSTQAATQTTFYQDQAQGGPEQPAGPAPGTGVRARLLQTINPEPVRDTQEEGRLQQLAKVNALGTALGSLGQLAGVASGGDAVEIRNNLNPWIMDRMAYLDDDYRNQVRDYTTRAFAMDRFNIDQQNQDIQDQNTNEWQKEQIRLRGEEARRTAEEQARLRLEEFAQKTDAEKEAEMRKIGIDPRAKDAFDQYIKRTNQQYGVNTNYRKSLTAENYANAARTEAGGSKGKKEFDLETLKKGRQAMLNQYDAQINQLKAKMTDKTTKIGDQPLILEQIKQLQSERNRYYNYNPGSNELLDSEIMDAANRDAGTQPESATLVEYMPGRGLTFNQVQKGLPQQTQPQQRSEEEIMQAMKSNRQSVIQNAKRIASINFEDPDPETSNLILEKAQELVDLGIFEDQDSAIESILQLAKSNAK